MAARQLRPLSLGDIFDEGFDLYKANLPILALITVLIIVPIDIVVGVVQNHYVNGLTNFAASGSDDPFAALSALGSLFRVTGGVLFVSSFFYAIPFCALAVASSNLYLGKPISLRQAYQLPLRRLPILLWTVLLYALSMAIASLFCVVGVIWPGIAFLFAAQVFSLEGKAGVAALKRSAQLVSSYSGRVFGALCLLILIHFIMVVGISVPLAYAFDSLLRLTPGGHSLFAAGDLRQTDMIRQEMVGQTSSGVADLLVLPFMISVITVLYYDLRVRKEAFDIELLARDLNYAPLPAFAIHPPPVAMPISPGVGTRGAR